MPFYYSMLPAWITLQAVKLHSTGRVTWYVNSRAMLEPLFRGRRADSAHARRQNDSRISPAHQSRCRGGLTESYSQFSGHEDEAERAAEAIVVVPVDFSAGSLEAVRLGVSVARYTQASILMCHAVFPAVIPFGPAAPPWVAEALRSEAMAKMAPFLALAEQAGVKAKGVVEEGTPAGVILKTSRQCGANLIVLTSREHSAWVRLFFGKTIAEQVAQEADCHVMLVRRAHT